MKVAKRRQTKDGSQSGKFDGIAIRILLFVLQIHDLHILFLGSPVNRRTLIQASRTSVLSQHPWVSPKP